MKRDDVKGDFAFQTDRNTTSSRFQGSSSISSEDYFGDPNKKQTDRVNYQGPDLATMKADLKDGVSKAATRLSSLASSVMSSIQVSISSRSLLVCTDDRMQLVDLLIIEKVDFRKEKQRVSERERERDYCALRDGGLFEILGFWS